jgi:DNA-binding response OmpR family regulator
MMEKKRTVLVADDEKEIRSLIRVYLEKDGYDVIEAEDGAEVLRLINEEIDTIILDIMMPHVDGVEVLRRVRQTNNVPIIIVSAKSEGCDRVLGLDLGADDYIVKPFDPLELVARVSSNIRRFYQLGSRNKVNTENITVKDVILDTQECVLIVNNERIILTSVEYKVLLLLMGHPGRVFTKQQLYEAGWEGISVVDDNSIMVCISKIRGKLNDTDGKYITTIRGLGYRFEK